MEEDAPVLHLAVDPGKKGAVACLFPSGAIYTANYTTTKDMADTLKEWETQSFLEHFHYRVEVHLESVHSSPQAGPKQSFAFGQNFGEWLGILTTRSVKIIMVKPQEWQRMIPGRSGKTGSELKNVLKSHAQRLFPNHKVTLTNADALLILNYATSK